VTSGKYQAEMNGFKNCTKADGDSVQLPLHGLRIVTGHSSKIFYYFIEQGEEDIII
jgi:hypothetical protein